jgi:hypothetical protein
VDYGNAEVPARLSDIALDFGVLRESGSAVQQLDDQREGNGDYIAWSYYLDEDDLAKFDRFTNYTGQSNGADIQINDQSLAQRNVIHHRYVVVTADSNRGNDLNMPAFMGVTYDPANVRNVTGSTNPANDFQPNTKDPFQVPCGSDNSEWLAIGMDFNADGEFLGYISRWCSQSLSHDDSVGIAFMTAVELVDHCTEVALVQNQGNPLRDILNKAWTNRLWQGARGVRVAEEGFAQITIKNHPIAPYSAAINRDTSSAPFGSFAVLNEDFSNEFAIRKNTFFIPENGVPYACRSPWLGSRVDLAQLRFCQNLGDTYGDEIKNFISRVGVGIAANVDPLDDGIQELFAEVFETRRFVYTFADNGRITREFVSDGGSDRAQTVGERENLMFPQVYATNPHACTQLKDCVAAEKNALTLNGRNGTMEDYNNDGSPDEDFDGNGTPDSFIGQASYYAVLNFFAFADDNRMPIRRVMVDWGDNSQVSDRMGLYQNRKPVCGGDDPGFADVGLCVDANNNPTGLTCDLGEAKKTCPTFDLNPAENQTCVSAEELKSGELGDDYITKRFGNTARACTENYFQYIHEYTCDRVTLAENDPNIVKKVRELGAEAGRLQRLGLGLDDLVCVYTPRVQIMDNWGWCNGQCTNNPNDYNLFGLRPNPQGVQDGCYNNFDLSAVFDEGTKDAQCNGSTVPGRNPWAYYNGRVILIPDIE